MDLSSLARPQALRGGSTGALGAHAARRRSVQLLHPRRPTFRCSVEAAKQQVQGTLAAEAEAARKECFGVFCTTYDLEADEKTKSWKKLVNVSVSGAAGMISNHLLFKLASGEVFGQDQPIALKLLGSERSLQALEGVAMELEDSLYPLLREVSIGIDPYVIFEDADWALLIGAKPRGPGVERAALLDINGQIFAEQGKALNAVASRNVKVIVVGNPCNTNALICLKNAPNLPAKNFHALTRLDENRAKCQLALKAGVFYDKISNMTIWGNHSTTQVPDFLNAKINGRPVKEVIKDTKWLEEDFTITVQKRGGVLIQKWGRSSAASTAVSIVDAMRSLVTPTPEGDWFSTGVYTTGNPYGIAEDIVFSMPCRSKGGGDYELVKDVAMDDFLWGRIKKSEAELIAEKKCVAHLTGEGNAFCVRPLSLPLLLLRCPAPARLSRPPPPPPPPPQGAQAPGNCRLLRAHGRPQRHRRRPRSSSGASASLSVSGPEMDPAARKDLYPHVEPFDTGRLRVSDVHTIYYEQSGNPGGHPVVFLHGGPGAGTSPGNRRFFDPEFYRIVLFDQRGAGKSTPHACLEENTTWDLVADIEKLRQHLDIPEWQVFGGSWGSTLALAYSQTHPDKVTGIVLRGIFLLRKKELDWFYEGGAAAVFPDAWEPFRDFIPEDERNCFIAAYSKRLTSSDADVQIEAAKRWTTWEMMTAHLLQNHENIKRGEDDKFSLAFARIENHYFINKGFLDSDSHLLDNVDKIRHIKTFIVQGRYDMCCPMMSAWDLHKAWPEAEFKVVPDAGHSANEVGVAAELVSANEKLKSMLKK